jgi:hypothetical protein
MIRMNKIDYPRTLGSKGNLIDIAGKRHSFEVIGEISCWQKNAPNEKRIYLQKILHDDKRLEYRFTYYMRGVKPGKTKGRWVFGQYSMMIPRRELSFLLKRAREERWPGF